MYVCMYVYCHKYCTLLTASINIMYYTIRLERPILQFYISSSSLFTMAYILEPILCIQRRIAIIPGFAFLLLSQLFEKKAGKSLENIDYFFDLDHLVIARFVSLKDCLQGKSNSTSMLLRSIFDFVRV